MIKVTKPERIKDGILPHVCRTVVHVARSMWCCVEIITRRGNGNSLQYSCLGNSMDKEAWQATVHKGHNEHELATKQQHSKVVLCWDYNWEEI